MRRVIGVFFIILCTHHLWGQKFTISGHITDEESGENLIGAIAYDNKTESGVVSNYYGFYSITLPSDTVKLLYSMVGYSPKTINFILTRDTVININLGGSTELKEVEVVAEKSIQEKTQMSKIDVPIKSIKKLPALLGEVDVMKTLQLLPGVQSGNEASSGIYVRGGSPDQNLILLDGVPVYNASHLFGFFSVFNADAINSVTLIKGGFPARYGGRLSSVVDINMKEGNNKKLKAQGGVGIISSRLTLEGPINDKTTFLVSGRRTYIDILTKPIIKAASDGANAGYYFYDLNGKINHKIDSNNRIYASMYLGNDKFYFKEDYSYYDDWQGVQVDDKSNGGINWGNITSALRWNRIINNKLFSNVTATFSKYRFRIFQDFERREYNQVMDTTYFQNVEYYSAIRDWGAKIDFDYIPNTRHSIKFGTNYLLHRFSPGVLNYSENSTIDTTLGASVTDAHEFQVYAEDDFELSKQLKFNLGLHASGFYVNRTFYQSLQPRLSGRYLINEKTSVKVSYATMAQYIHLLSNTGIGLPTDLWVPATDSVLPQRSDQVAIGFAHNYKSKYEISLEGYYKNINNIISYKEGASYLNVNENWEQKVESGRGWSYGAELLVQKKVGKLTGWIGYTLSWTFRQFENINFGEVYPYKYDRRHDISVAMVYEINDKINLSGTWVYGTGNAVTLPVAAYPAKSDDNGWFQRIYRYEGRNGFRMRDYHRLDVAVRFIKKKKWGERTWVLGVYNAYNRKNPFFLDIGRDDFGNRQFIQYSLFPLIPSISYNFEFK